MGVIILLCFFTLFVAYANGANDNFKGVATLFAANVTGYRTAIAIATASTFAGCVASVFVADALVQAFSGKGLVPDIIAASPVFLLAVATGAGSTVLLAACLGFPISTTHGLTGALTGAGLVAASDKLDLGVLGSAFFMPLLISPAISILLTMSFYWVAHHLAGQLGVRKESCVCLAPGSVVPVAHLRASAGGQCCATGIHAEFGEMLPSVHISAGSAPACVEKYSGAVLGMTAQKVVDAVHYLSAVAVSFARGLNDAPKIVALMLVLEAVDLRASTVAIAAAMALGGWINAQKVAETMSKKISTMNDGQALSANLVTAFLVIFASRLGMPVSTTHVSVGAIAGVGIVNRSANTNVVGSILMSWLLTLPVSAMVSALAYLAYRIIL